MKELILIGAHCPDEDRVKLLNDCIESLQGCRNNYDVLICSHTIIPDYITKKVDYVFYDKNNDLITDLKYLNQPWFSPVDRMTILSTYIGESSTYLAVYRLLILGLGFAKMFKYKKVHYVEYDSVMNNHHELYKNSKLLDEYDNVVYQKEQEDGESYLAWPIGYFMSFKVESINEIFTTYDKEKLLKILSETPSKTNEKITNDIMQMNGNTIFIKDYKLLVDNNIKVGLSRNTERDSMTYWTVPYYNPKENKVSVVVWNNKDETPINVSFIINNTQIVSFNNVKKFSWEIRDIGKIEDIDSILILVNNKIKTHIILNEETKELFKQTNYVYFT